jgi:RNA polymerase sigma-70 factor (ECF subfamily)
MVILVPETPVRDRTERRTLKALRARRHEVYEQVIDAHYGSIYRLLLFLTRDASLAEDITQDVFASAWGAIHDFRGDASIRTWLHRIAYNAFLDLQRRRERESKFTAKLYDQRPEVAADPLAGIMADEQLARVCGALDGLDVSERAVLVLHYIDGLTYREMAQVLGRSDGTLKWMINRALGKLRKRLAGKVET